MGQTLKAATAKKAIGYEGDGTSDDSTISFIHATYRGSVTAPADFPEAIRACLSRVR